MSGKPVTEKITKFTNCYIVRTHEIQKDDLWIRKGKILNPENLFFCEKALADEIVDCGGCLIAPGFIDLQINGGFGVDFSYETEKVAEGINLVASKLLSYGVTAFCPTIVSSTADVYKKVLPKIWKRQGGPDGATVLGVHLEGPFINPEKHGAHEEKNIKDLSEGYKTLTDMYGPMNNVCIITLAPELPNAMEVIEKLVVRRLVVSMGHSSSTIAQAEQAVQKGATFITHLFNAMGHFHHRDPGLIGLIASPLASKIFYGLICDGTHTHPASVRLAYRAHPQGCVLVSDAISALGLPEGTHHLGGQLIDVKDGKAYVTETGILCGSIVNFLSSVKFFKEASGCTLVEALETGSLHPARVLELHKQKGTLNYHSDADFIMLNENLELLETWVNGQQAFKAENIVSKAFTSGDEIIRKQNRANADDPS